jgi:hypothetical protein
MPTLRSEGLQSALWARRAGTTPQRQPVGGVP